MVVLKSSFYLRFSSRDEDIAPDLPVVQDEFAIGCEGGFDLRSANALFDARRGSERNFVQQAVAQLAMAPISAWRSCFQEFRDIAPNSGLRRGFRVTGGDGVSPRRVAELVFWAIVGGLRSQKYEGGKSTSGARQSRCDVGAV